MFCTKCGNDVKDGSAFCTSCGAPINQAPVEEAPVQEAPVVEEKKQPVNDFQARNAGLVNKADQAVISEETREAKKQEQLAKEEGVNVEVIHSRLYRAKQWIRKNYQAEYDEYIRMTQG